MKRKCRSAPPSKWKISEGIKSVELFGDLKLRYEDRSAEDPAGNSIDLQRFRYAVRLGLRGSLFDDFYYGFRLDTGAKSTFPFCHLWHLFEQRAVPGSLRQGQRGHQYWPGLSGLATVGLAGFDGRQDAQSALHHPHGLEPEYQPGRLCGALQIHRGPGGLLCHVRTISLRGFQP